MTPEIVQVITALVQYGFSVKINHINDKEVLFDSYAGNTDYTKDRFRSICAVYGVKLDIWSDVDRVFGVFYK